MVCNQGVGMLAEYYFIKELNRLGIPYKYITKKNNWFDFIALGQRVEIKSCQLTVKDFKKVVRNGRFDFTSELNRDLQYLNNIWVGFILRYKKDFMFLGLCRAKKLKKKRYIVLNKLREFNLISLDDWAYKYGNYKPKEEEQGKDNR